MDITITIIKVKKELVMDCIIIIQDKKFAIGCIKDIRVKINLNAIHYHLMMDPELKEH